MLFRFLDINKTTTYLCLSFTDYSGFFPRRFGKEQDLLPSLFVSNQLCIIVKKKFSTVSLFQYPCYVKLMLIFKLLAQNNILLR